MKKLALAALLAAGVGLPACTTFNPHRRQLTDWSVAMLREKPDPCGTFPAESHPCKGKNCVCNRADRMGRKVVDVVCVKPIVAVVMIPAAWLTDTLILNPIEGWKKAEVETHERKTCKAEHAGDKWSDVHADQHSYGVVPTVTPWPIGYLLSAPEFVARFAWNALTPTDPICPGTYGEYWREHNESTGSR